MLVIGAELLGRFVDRDDRTTAALFGDGAGAAVIVPASAGSGRIGPILLRADAGGTTAIRLELAEGRIRMDGHDTYRAAVRRLSESTVDAAERAGVALADIDLFVYHQANARILRSVARQIGLDEARVVDAIADYGNTSVGLDPDRAHRSRVRRAAGARDAGARRRVRRRLRLRRRVVDWGGP